MKYKEMLISAIKELETELNKIPSPTIKDLKVTGKVSRKKKVKKNVDFSKDISQVETIDVSYSQNACIY